MDWGEWTRYLSELVGFGSGRVLLLVPRRGESDLTEAESADLADAVHRGLFCSGRTAGEELRRLSKGEDPTEPLPLLYLSSWLARQQETNLSFWPHFNAAIVREKLASQTVQQSLAPLITDLWWRMHRECGIYRPQEGRVNVKWPQAHAGLTDGELDYVGTQVVRTFGWSEAPPDTLYDEPDEFLGLLRGWVQSGYGATQRLRQLVLGPAALALLVSEVAQRWLLESWPPPKPEITTPVTAQRLPSPFLSLAQDPVAVSLVLPPGELPGFHMIEADYEGDRVRLEVSFTQRQSTVYRSHEWALRSAPWPRDLQLHGSENYHLLVRPECPFDDENGAIMFEPGSGAYVKRWKPNRQFLILLPRGARPDWLDALFVAVESMDFARLGDVDVELIAAIGRDLAENFDRETVEELLRRAEQQLQDSRALISLPDTEDLFRPEIVLWGGAPLEDAKQISYLAGDPPAIVVRNLSRGEVAVTLHMRRDDGEEVRVASATLNSREGGNAVLLEPRVRLEEGLYVVRGAKEPHFFRLVPPPSSSSNEQLAVDIQLNAPQQGITTDDMRLLVESGATVIAWPNARVVIRADSEAGTYLCPAKLDSIGIATIHVDDIHLSPSTAWCRLSAKAWLASSPVLELWLKPYIAQWSLDSNRFSGSVLGCDNGAACEVIVVPEKPWTNKGFKSIPAKVDAEGTLCVDLPMDLLPGWIVVADHDCVWLATRISGTTDDSRYDLSDFREAVAQDSELPALIAQCNDDSALSALFSLVELVRISRISLIPHASDALPQSEIRTDGGRLDGTIAVRLPPTWGGAMARLIIAVGSSVGRLTTNERSFAVRVDEVTQGGIKLRWDEVSGPCLCATCQSVMTQKGWYNHGCEAERSSLTVLGSTLTVLERPDWPTFMHTLETRVTRAIADGGPSPAGLDWLWDGLQRVHREIVEQHAISPTELVEGTFQAWRTLFDLKNGDEVMTPWADLFEKVKPFESALLALAELKRER